MAAQRRYDVIEPHIRSTITWLGETVREQAREWDEGAERAGWRGLLHGLIVGVKDNIDTAGVRTTSGSPLFSARVPSTDATVVRLMKEAGALVIAKCNMAELAFGATTQNRTFGSCRNPWDLGRIPGGSSGGSGAGLAAGLFELALGTDTGASTRIPASVNGVVGLRPTLGRISNVGVMGVSPSLDTVGPMARTVVNVARLTTVLTWNDPEDPFTVRRCGPHPLDQLNVPVKGVRVGIPQGYFWDGVDSGVAESVQHALVLLERRGAQLLKVTVPDVDNAFEHWTRIIQSEAASVHRQKLLDLPDSFSPDVRSRLQDGWKGTPVDLAGSYLWRARYRKQLERIFDVVDVVAAPTIGVDVPAIEGFDSLAQTKLLGALTYPWALYHGPTMSLPVGFHDGSGMPVGMAVAAAPWHEAVAFRVGADYQRFTDWHRLEPRSVSQLLHEAAESMPPAPRKPPPRPASVR